MNYSLVSTILKGIWAIDESTAVSYIPLIESLLGRSAVKFDFSSSSEKIILKSVSMIDNESVDGLDNAKENSIAIIPLSGPLMKRDQNCGPVGMATISSIIHAADKNPNIDGIILHIDSPGGTVDGTVELASSVKNTTKPVIAFVDGQMASAAFWIGSSADEIIASTSKAEIGSVGVMLSFQDLQPAYEKMGVKFHSIVSDQTQDKNKLLNDLKMGNYKEFKQSTLNPIAEDFISHLKSNLPNISEDILTGKVFFAQNLVGSVVDSIGNLQHAIDRMKSIVSFNSQLDSSNLNSNKTSMKKSFKNLSALLGNDLEVSDDGVFLNESQIEIIDNALSDSPLENLSETTQTETTVEKPKVVDPDPRDAKIATLEKRINAIESSVDKDPDVSIEQDDLKQKPVDDISLNYQEAKKMWDTIS